MIIDMISKTFRYYSYLCNTNPWMLQIKISPAVRPFAGMLFPLFAVSMVLYPLAGDIAVHIRHSVNKSRRLGVPGKESHQTSVKNYQHCLLRQLVTCMNLGYSRMRFKLKSRIEMCRSWSGVPIVGSGSARLNLLESPYRGIGRLVHCLQ